MVKRVWTTGVIAVVLILLAACTGTAASPTPGATTPGASATPKPPPAIPTVPTGYTELDKALGADMPFKGKTVNIQTQWIGQEGTDFAAAVADFATATGIKIQIDSIGSSHETVLRTRIQGGTPPDLAMLAQPTPVLAYAADGKVTDVSTFMPAEKLNTEFPSTIGLVSKDGHIWGIPYKADVKSTIWYPIKAFAAAGYKVPTTWDELITLSDKIIADGKGNPWCVSAGGPGDATGWQITDWVEEVVLKTKGLDYYNQWISHDVTFQDQGIKDAFNNYVGKIFFTDKYVYGGPTAIVNTDQKTPMDPMFDAAGPKCWMQKIPTWYGPGFFPDQRASGQPSKYIIGSDIGIFPFPKIDAAQNNVEGSADTLMVTVPPSGVLRDEVKAVAEFLATPAGVQNYIRNGNAISANAATPKEWYAGSVKLTVASDIVNAASGIGFDASDLMPGAVGTGTFWTQSVAWVTANGTNTDAVLKAIDDSWPPAP